MLIVLYLEDKLEPKRVRELMADLEKHRKQPSWDDAYIAALLDRNDGSPRLMERVSALRNGLNPNDPRNAVLNNAFGA